MLSPFIKKILCYIYGMLNQITKYESLNLPTTKSFIQISHSCGTFFDLKLSSVNWWIGRWLINPMRLAIFICSSSDKWDTPPALLADDGDG